MTFHAVELRQAHDPWLRGGRLALAEWRGESGGVPHAIFQDVPVGPARVIRGQLRVRVHRNRETRLASFHEHVAEIQEKSLEVVRGDPRVPTDALGSVLRLEAHVL